MRDLLAAATSACLEAGGALMSLHGKPIESREKEDGSPVTQADRDSHLILVDRLEATGIPVVSEEGRHPKRPTSCYWLIDPLDGTREFIEGNGEFSVNVALIEDGVPILGVIHGPAKSIICSGASGSPAKISRPDGSDAPSLCSLGGVLSVVHSRHEDLDCIKAVSETNNIRATAAIGSALKFVAVAVADATYYVRFQGSSEWDTAAGQAILSSLGGAVVGLSTRMALSYGKAGRRNPAFLACRSSGGADCFKVCHPVVEPL